MATGKKETVEIETLRMKSVRFEIIGTSPLIMHRFSSKAQKELLFPSGRKSRTTRAVTLKHDPVAEFREAIYRTRNSEIDNAPTAIHLPSGCFKEAIASAALDLPGATKSKIERLTRVTSETIPLWGIPLLRMDMTRSSDMARTPDVRTRPGFKEWACEIEVRFCESLITQRDIVSLVMAAGELSGIGDWRSQKGGTFGGFTIVESPEHRALFDHLKKVAGKEAQFAAMQTPEAYDEETSELLEWFESELIVRERTATRRGAELEELEDTEEMEAAE